MKINSAQSNNINSYKPNFCGITKAMSKQVFVDGKKDILRYLENRTRNTNVGNLPPCIFEKLPKQNRAAIIKEILTMFEETARIIREFRPSIQGSQKEYKNRRPDSIVERMKTVFNKYKILDNPNDFDLIYLDKGEYKSAYLMKGLKEEKTGDMPCFKVFHLVDKTPEWHKYKGHGNYAELNSAIYWRKAEGNYADINRFYCGDMDSGYLIDRYIDDEIVPPSNITKMYDRGCKNTDVALIGNGHNIKNGYLFDQGGYRVLNRVKNKSNTARYVLKLIEKTSDKEKFLEWIKICNAPKYKHLDDVQKKAGLALAIKHLKPREQVKAADTCISYNKPIVDMAIAYALKYMPEESATKYFTLLLKRKDKNVQEVLLNEIPLLSTKEKAQYDDINTPRHKVDPEKVYKYYQIAKQYAIPEVEEHLASYVHLLPSNVVKKETEALIAKKSYSINDRLIHKIRYEQISPDGYSFGDKMSILQRVQETDDNPFIQKKVMEVRRKIINEYNDDNN